MGKVLSWLLIFALGYALYRFAVLLKRRSEAQARGRRPEPDAGPEPIVRCDLCGVHVPRSEAVFDGERRFCSAAHRDQARGPR